ncbi:MAG TPA: CmpA/NrtA family ABC transporter substrate-binding protein [Verrucomicrobiota bacterium]|nr:CmpA/NrtA family ABC transporter substrate-binding protein [Verrucomicrobiota bacterium]
MSKTPSQLLKTVLGLTAVTVIATALSPVTAPAANLEKTDLKFGFIKLTDCVPIIIAKEMNYFEDEGLYVTVEAQSNWKILLDRVISGELDGAHMLAGQPIAATIGFGTKAHVITAFSMDLNGNGITLGNAIWEQMKEMNPSLAKDPIERPLKADLLKPVVQKLKSEGTPMKMGMVFPVSTHNYELRYWLASGGISPGYYTATDTTGTKDADVLISVTPPPQMPATLAQGTIQGYCVGEPWNQQAVIKGIGVAPITDYEIWKNNPEKVFGVTAEWDKKNPNTHVAVVKALIRAGKWLDASPENRKKACEILSKPEYVGADVKVIANSMTGTWEYHKGDVRPMPDFNVFFRYYATYPYYSDCIWYLTQMRRWGQITEAKPDEWYLATAKEVYKPETYMKAAEALIKEGKLKADEVPKTDGFKAPTAEFIDGIEYDGKKPNDYLKKFPIGLKD